MESASTTGASCEITVSTTTSAAAAHEAAAGCGGWSIKKPKHRKARALKLLQQQQQQQQQRSVDKDHADLVDHQQHHLRRLKPACCSDDLDNNCLPSTPWDFSKSAKGDRDAGGHGVNWSWAGKGKKQHQKQSMRAAVESRRRLARGPRSGSTAVADAQGGGGGGGPQQQQQQQQQQQPMLPSEDHRVVSTDYQAAGTQALMRVTLLAAGFVIGARGISARLIGQVTGAIVQSWTESCRPDSIPIRLFRIQGKKAVVQAAVALIEQAVAKYKELCECKRRGEFVQREHVISGVEFYYQPPPRKAFANNNCKELQSPKADQDAASAPTFLPHHVWLQHLQQQQQQQQVQQKQQAHNISLLEASQITKGENKVDGHGQDHNVDITQQSHVFFDWQPKVDRQLMGLHSPEEQCGAPSDFELLDHGLQQSVASLEQALQQVRLEQRLLQRNRDAVHQVKNDSSLWIETSSERQFQLGPSLFFFGDGGLPLPICSSAPDGSDHAVTGTGSVDHGTSCIFLDAATPCTPFDFPHCDFLRESLPNFSWSSATRDQVPDYSLYEAASSPALQEEMADDSICIVCLEHPASVHLVPCGHNLFCFSCVGGLLTCPLCRQPIVALHPRGTNPITPDIVDVNPSNLNTASSYNMWNWIPGASV